MTSRSFDQILQEKHDTNPNLSINDIMEVLYDLISSRRSMKSRRMSLFQLYNKPGLKGKEGHFGLILLLISIPVVCAIIRIMKIRKQRTSSFTLDTSPEMEPEEKYSIKFTPKLPEIVKDSSNHSKPKDMEET